MTRGPLNWQTKVRIGHCYLHMFELDTPLQAVSYLIENKIISFIAPKLQTLHYLKAQGVFLSRKKHFL